MKFVLACGSGADSKQRGASSLFEKTLACKGPKNVTCFSARGEELVVLRTPPDKQNHPERIVICVECMQIQQQHSKRARRCIIKSNACDYCTQTKVGCIHRRKSEANIFSFLGRLARPSDGCPQIPVTPGPAGESPPGIRRDFEESWARAAVTRRKVASAFLSRPRKKRRVESVSKTIAWL